MPNQPQDPSTQSTTDYGPFTSVLTAPLTAQNEAPSLTGAPSKGGAIALYLGKFLQGAQVARRQQYEKSEAAKREGEGAMFRYAQAKMADPNLSPEGKQALTTALNTALAQQAQETLKDSDKGSKGKDPHPLLALTKQITNAVLGPGENPKHKDFGSLTAQLMTIGEDPKYRIDPNAISAESISKPPVQAQPAAQQPTQQGQTASQQQSPLAQGYLGTKYPATQQATPPPPGTTPAAAQAPSALPFTTQAEAWNNPWFINQVKTLAKVGRDWKSTPLGDMFNSLPKASGLKPVGAPYTVKENGKDILRRDYFDAASGQTVTQTLGDAKDTAASRPVLGSSRVTLADAKKLEEKGAAFNILDDDGNHIAIKDVPPGMQLQPVMDSKRGTYYKPVTPSQVLTIVGNEVYTSTAQDRGNVGAPGSSGVTDLGVKNTGTTGTHEIPVVDGQGNTVAAPMQSSSRPNTVGANNRVAPPGSAASPVVPNTTTPTRTPPPLRNPSAATSTTTPAAGSATPAPPQGRLLLGMQAGERNNQMARLVPVRAASMQLFGDPKQPNTKSLLDFAELADNPAATEKLGTALKIAFDKIHQSQSSSGGFGEWLKNTSGAQAAIEQSRAQVLQDSLKDLQNIPGATDAFNATLAAYSSAIGLRAISKASGSQASAAAIERDLPMIGVNTSGSRDVYDKLSHYAQEVNDGTKGLGVQVFEPGEAEYFRGGIQKKIEGLKKQAIDPSIKSLPTKAGITLQVGGTYKGKVITGFSTNGDIHTQ